VANRKQLRRIRRFGNGEFLEQCEQHDFVIGAARGITSRRQRPLSWSMNFATQRTEAPAVLHTASAVDQLLFGLRLIISGSGMARGRPQKR
jgi:hypothetical protein